VIQEKASESKGWWAPRVVPPEGAPNVLLIMTDDAGFGAPGTFGGVVPTPALDRVAENGLRYTNFHSTSLCSPTRAALITGRNHHVAGFGVVGEVGSGFPGYNSILRKEVGTIGTILKQNGYSTSWFGKTTTPLRTSRLRPGPSTSGRTAWASRTSTASWAVTPASGSRTSSATPRRSSPSRTTRAGT
jgi:arylsulfatase A-like enzyme